jgi:hypothetical protein
MKNDNLNTILSDLAENAKPAVQIDLWPSLKKDLAASDGQSKEGNPIIKGAPVLRRAAFATLSVLIALSIWLFTPQGQTFAQELLNYFTTASQTSIPPLPTPVLAPTYTLETTLTPQPTIFGNSQSCGEVVSPIVSTFVCQLQHAQTKLGFVVKSFPAQYLEASFQAMWVEQDHRSIAMIFRDQQTTYTLEQGLGDFPKSSPLYEDAVQFVRVGDFPGEYAKGMFIFPDGQVNKDMVWEPSASVYHLRWKENSHWYSFTLSENQGTGPEPSTIQAKMIKIAENLVSLEQGNDQLTAGDQPSLQDSASFIIKELTLLPEGFQQVDSGSWGFLTTAPRVGIRYDLIINGQWVSNLTLDQMLIPIDGQTLRREFALIYQNQTVPNGEWAGLDTDEEVQINGVTGYYLDCGESYCSALNWHDDEREYLMIYRWTPDFGGRLDKETLIAIAESLK